MAKNNFLLVDLNDKKMKTLGETITSQSSRTILSSLSDASEGKSESQIAKETGLKLTTVHYNLQKLQEAQLVESSKFKYSSKGREVKLYSLANKYIIIAPKKVTGIRSKLREILPVGLVILGIGAVIEWTQRAEQFVAGSSAPQLFIEETSLAPEAAMEGIMRTAPVAADLYVQVVPWWQQIPSSVYFIAGAIVALGVYLGYKKFLASREN